MAYSHNGLRYSSLKNEEEGLYVLTWKHPQLLYIYICYLFHKNEENKNTYLYSHVYV